MTAIHDDIITSRPSLKMSFRGLSIIMPSLGPRRMKKNYIFVSGHKWKMLKHLLRIMKLYLGHSRCKTHLKSGINHPKFYTYCPDNYLLNLGYKKGRCVLFE